MFKKKRIYLDTAATTPIDKEVARAMEPFYREVFGNSSSIHKEGEKARRALEDARRQIASTLGALPDEIVFTSGGTESNNLTFTVAGNDMVVSSAIEHSSVMNISRDREKKGLPVVMIPVLANGLIDLEKAKQLITKETRLVSVMMASNEIGTVQPIKEIAKIIRKIRKESGQSFPYLHTDACQAGRFLSIDVNKLGVDLLTLNSSKIYGPKGVGLLYVRRGVPIEPIFWGGGQESGRRSGTENVSGIVGFAKALEIAKNNSEAESKRLTAVRDFFWQEIKTNFPTAVLHGELENRLPNNLNFSLPGFDAEQLVIELDQKGVACSTGSACSVKEADESYVIMALTGDRDLAKSALRFSLGRDTTISDIKKVVEYLKQITKKLTSI